MVERKIMEVLRQMQTVINEEQLRELKTVLNMVFSGCDISEETSLRIVDDSWNDDMDDFLMSKALEGLSVKTIDRYRYELTRMLSYINRSVINITDRDISEYMQAYKRFRGISNQTLKNIRSVFSSFFVWLRDRGRIIKNPMALVEKIKVEKRIKKPFSDEERERMFRVCKNLRDKALLEFLYSTAVRVSELTRLNREDVCFSAKNLIVYGKGGKERKVYLNEKSSMYLQEYLLSRTDDNPALFVGVIAPYNRMTKAGVEDAIRRIGRRADVKKAHPHRFRRTAITNALNRGMPLHEARSMAGHVKVDTTLLYCETDQQAVQYHHKIYLCS